MNAGSSNTHVQVGLNQPSRALPGKRGSKTKLYRPRSFDLSCFLDERVSLRIVYDPREQLITYT
jgi:hypothetical protein